MSYEEAMKLWREWSKKGRPKWWERYRIPVSIKREVR